MRTAVLKTFFLATMLCGLVLPPAQAEVRILASAGGQVGPFLDLFERVRVSGERVVIDGPCLSACTLVLSMVPNDRICVTRRAILGFHAARSVDPLGRIYAEPEASELVLAHVVEVRKAGCELPSLFFEASGGARQRRHANDQPGNWRGHRP